jgi:hypothetical protein
MFDWYFEEIEDPVLKFICLWITFNQWYKIKYEKEKLNLSDRGCLERIKNDYSIYHHVLRRRNLSSLYNTLVKVTELAKELKFKNVPRLMFDNYHIEQDQDNFNRLLELFYEIRNAIFHGEMSLKNEKLRELTAYINNIFKDFISRVILNPRITN